LIKRFFGFSIEELREMTIEQFGEWVEEMENIYELEAGQNESIDDVRARVAADPAVRML